ncbi:MAG: M36 family metallopeptidase [Bacteroidetes bacterium]|nr:M36 family metallopeptidase [Bacteroidota bacterium]
MKKQLLLFFALILGLSSFAQVSKNENQLAMDLVKANAKSIGLTDTDINNVTVSSTYETVADHLRMVYLQQTYKGIPVFNQMHVLAFRNNKLVSVTGGRIDAIEKKVNNLSGVPQTGPSDAVRSALTDRKISLPSMIFPYGQSGSKTMFGDMGIATNNITAELVWLPQGKSVILTWQVEVAPLKSDDHWLIRVDAATGSVLDKNNYTVYEQFPEPDHFTGAAGETGNHNIQHNFSVTEGTNSPFVVNSASYRVVPYPAESPIHPGGTATLVTDPWTLASGNATSLKWNYDGTTYHDSTRGNNVWAQEDRDNNNSTFGKTAISTTGQPTLTFDFTPNFTQAPTVTINQQYATTNLFYWNNIMHDLTYQYGFDEPSGNFQANNQGRGGSGNDYVIADAQDAGGTNNANFSTPADGSRPRMQMYLFNTTTPNRDGDLDNGVVCHEYAHGISNRLTGGPSNTSCLGNAEQGGEGWSDYFALMLTTNWATAQITDGALARPMGTYVLNQATTGAGIRTYPYSTNMSINPWTYANMASTSGEVHVIGEIWCMALWEMTWEMIQQDGINTNLFNAAGTGGNSAALKLVTEGMRLQPCSPGYIDARNAILKADTLFFGAKYSCAIWKAFAKRGMGQGASQGSSGSTADQVASFVNNGGLTLRLTQSVTSQQEGLNVTYTNRVSSGGCSAISNYLLTDTLPSNVTYVSGGTYNATTRVVSFNVNLAQGALQDYSFTVQINPGSYFAPANLINETVASASIPSGWAATTATGTTNWTTSTTQSHSAPNSFFALDNSAAITDFRLSTTTPVALGAIPPVFSFWHYYNMESGWDGGVVEISTNNGTTWTDLGSNIISNGYNGSVAGTNPIAGRSAFTGNSGGFVQTKISLLPYANQNALFRFRATSDDNTAATGWYVDDIFMATQAVVNMRSNLFNNLGVRISFMDTTTIILPSTCVAGSITTQPANTSVCATSNTSFSIAATGTSITYQWQVSTDGGSTYTNINGETNSTLSLNSVTVSLNNNWYRCQISGTCTNVTNSNGAILTVNALPVAPGGANGNRCSQGTVNIAASAGIGETIDWYAAASGGSALQTASPSFTTPVIGTTTIYYAEARNTTTGCVSATRTAVTATINANPVTPSGTGAARCGTGAVTIIAGAGSGETIDWYSASTGGSLLSSGSLSFLTPTISSTTTYYAQARNISTGCTSVTRTPVTATINAIPSAPAGTGAIGCGPSTLTLTATANGGETVDWYANATGGTALSSGNTSFNVSVSSTTTYFAEKRNTTTGCVSATRTPVTATINTSTNSTTNISICATALPYVWNNTTFTSGGTYTVVLVNAAGCDSLAKLLLDVSAAIAIKTVTGGGSYVIGGNGVPVGLNGSETGVSYQLLLNGNPVGTPVAGTNAAISFGNQTQAGTYTVFATTSLCSQLMSGSATVSIISGPPSQFTVTGGGTYCTGGAGVAVGLSGSQVGINYQLQRSGGTVNVGTPVAGTGSALNFGLQTTAADYSVLATNPSTLATAQMLNSVNVRIASGTRAPSAPGAINGPADACPFMGVSNVTYFVNQASNATSYIWTAPAGATIIGSNTDTSVVIQYPTSFVSGTLSVQSVNACFGNATSSARTLNITRKIPSTPGAITASLSNPCPIVGTAQTASYSIRQVANATGYTWTLSAGITFVSNLGDTAVIVQFDNGFTTGTVSVVAYNNCVTSAARTLAVTAKAPSTPGAISGVTNVCAFVGQATSSTYTIAAVSGAGSYLWTVPANATIVSGQGTTTIQVSFATGFSGGALTVKSVAACGNSTARSISLTATVPGAPTAITGINNVCSFIGQPTSATYSINAVSGAGSYLWAVPANATIVSGQGTTSVQVSFASGFTGGSLTVRSVAACGNSSARSLALVKNVAKPGPITASAASCPSTTVTYSIDPVPFATSYIWSVPSNATLVSGQGTTSFTVSYNANFVSGTVTVKSVNNCSTSAVSSLAVSNASCTPPPPFAKNGLSLNTTAVAESNEILIYPNPSNGNFSIRFKSATLNGKVMVQLTDMFGKKIKEQEVYVQKDGMVNAYFTAGNIVSGVYEIRIANGSNVAVKKVFITK